MSRIQRVFITVKTYPTISQKYDELVCTAGVLENGGWIRIYPLPFRKLDFEDRFRKYQWVELPLSRNYSDVRPESFKVDDLTQVKLCEEVGSKDGWAERKRILFAHNQIYDNLTDLIESANKNELSIGIFKPEQIINFKVEEVERVWSKDKLDFLTVKAQQLSLFQTEAEVKKEFLCVKKLPYKFSYSIKDRRGRISKMMIEDWEIGALFWNCLTQCEGDEQKAVALVEQKYLTEFQNKDVYLFLGTTKKFHGMAPNPFVIIGVFYPPIELQASLF